jgi:hypothetical protein
MQLPEGTSASTKEVAKVLSITGGDSVQVKEAKALMSLTPWVLLLMSV